MKTVQELIDEYKNRCVNPRYTSITTLRNVDQRTQSHFDVSNITMVDGWLEFDAVKSKGDITGLKYHQKMRGNIIEYTNAIED